MNEECPFTQNFAKQPQKLYKIKKLYKLKHELKGNLGLRSFQGTPMSNKVNVNYCNF